MTQPGPFSSITTATGLPSTPSRNASLQPQARRACVNPFSMVGSYYKAKRPASTRAAGVSQQRLDFLLELLFRRDPRVLQRDVAVAADEHRHRNAPERAERVLHVLVVLADQHGIIHLHLRGVRLQLVDRIVDRNAE